MFSEIRSVIKRKNNPTLQTLLLVVASFYNCYRVSVIERSDDRATRGKRERENKYCKRTKSKELRKEKNIQQLNLFLFVPSFYNFYRQCLSKKQATNETHEILVRFVKERIQKE